MSNETTLFAHIMPRFTNRIEDVAVEALGHILSQSRAAREALEEELHREGVQVGSIAKVQTQVTGEKGERPDLVCFDEDGTKHVLIEAKFWAGLTKNQPNQYLNQLQQDRQGRPAVLLFVAPKSRIEHLWPKLYKRAQEGTPKFELSFDSDSVDLRTASIAGGKHRLFLTSWAALLGSMETRAREAGDASALGDIKQLRGLTDGADANTFVSLSPEELGSEFARRMEGLRKLVDEAVSYGRSAGFLTPNRIAKGGLGGYGRSIQLGSVKAWFGIEIFAWADYHDSPLWLRLDDDGHGQLKGTELTEKMFRPYPGWSFRVPVKLPTGVDYEEVLYSVVSRLQSITRELDPDSIEHAAVDLDGKKKRGFADRMDAYAFLPWRLDELEPMYAKQVIGLHEIIDKATSRGRSAGFLKSSRTAPRLEGYGRSIRFDGAKAWFGIHLGGWARHYDTPLWLVFDHLEEPRLANMTSSIHEVNWKYCIPIDVPASAEHDEVLESVFASLKCIADQLKSTDA